MAPEEQIAHLRVTLLQWASSLDPAENLASLEEAGQAATGSDLVVLPEAFARDFGEPGSDLAPYAEPVDGPFASRLGALADEQGVTFLAGMFETSGDPSRPYNTLVLAEPGRLSSYRKIHLYDSFGYRESDRVAAGSVEPKVVELGGFGVGLMTCYDLRFPELARSLVQAGAEVLVVPAAWVAGSRKIDHWRTLVRARAIENTAYVVAVGQPGPRYSGHSMVVSPDGDVLIEAEEERSESRAVLDRSALTDARGRNASLANRRM